MKNKTISITFFLNLFMIFQLNAQDVKNFYNDLTGQLISGFEIYNNNASYPFSKNLTFSQTGSTYTGPYDGEYEIDIEKLFWWYQNSDYGNAAISYQMEIVSFPFTMDCAFELGCGFNSGDPNYSDDRILSMPSSIAVFNPNTESWQYPSDPNAILYGKLPIQQFYGKFSSDDISFSIFAPSHALVSSSFRALTTSPYFLFDHRILPHTVIKHTINIHCNSDVNSKIVNSIAFINDNTRSWMQYYPFYPHNYGGTAQVGLHDLVFVPEILVNNMFTDFSNPPSDIIMPGNGSIDYFPFTSINNNHCNSLPIPLNTSDPCFLPIVNSQPGFNSIFAPPNALLNAHLRQFQGDLPAGYKVNPGNVSKMIKMVTNLNLKHQYKIDQNIDLKIINSTEKIIYNPSEVKITSTSDNLHFPSHYTFKTIRGVYPSPVEVFAANTIENGGPYSDSRDVPVPTDLSPSPTEPWLASTYTLEAGSQLTFDPCLTIYDASFYVKPLSTLVIENDDLLFGKHRHRIFNQGGLVLTRNQNFFLQNENVVSPQNYQYESKTTIEAGNNVTTLKPNGDYVVESGSSVHLIAENEIHLTDGFHAETGSDFHAEIAPVIVLPCPPFRLGDSSGSSNNLKNRKDKSPECFLFPNPAKNQFKVYFKDLAPIESITILNAVGQVIFSKNYAKQMAVEINCSEWNESVYFVQTKSNSRIFTNKLVMNK